MNVSNLINHSTSGAASSATSCFSIDTLLNPCSEPSNKRRRQIDDTSLVSTNRFVFNSPVSVSSWPLIQLEDVSILPPTSHFRPSSDLDAVARRLAQSRLVGLRHRENEKIRTVQLELDITALQQENDILAYRIQEARCNPHILDVLRSKERSDSISISTDSSRIIGSGNITGDSALLLLELIALRRNIVPLHRYEGMSPNSALYCPDYLEVENAVQGQLWNPHNIERHAMWADHEANSTTEEGKERLSKKCTRCGKIRMAGSGHPRSSCDDGFRIASAVPYREAPETENKWEQAKEKLFTFSALKWDAYLFWLREIRFSHSEGYACNDIDQSFVGVTR